MTFLSQTEWLASREPDTICNLMDSSRADSETECNPRKHIRVKSFSFE